MGVRGERKNVWLGKGVAKTCLHGMRNWGVQKFVEWGNVSEFYIN